MFIQSVPIQRFDSLSNVTLTLIVLSNRRGCLI
jgi:hypothetical protein